MTLSVNYQYLLTAIDSFNKGFGVITKEGRLVTNEAHQAPALEVFNLFFKVLSDSEQKPTRYKEWRRIEHTLTVFVGKAFTNKEAYLYTIQKVVENQTKYLPLNRIKTFVTQLPVDAKIASQDLRMLEYTLFSLGVERSIFTYLTLYVFAEVYKNQIIDQFYALGGKICQVHDGWFSIDWEHCPKQTAEEFAIACRLEKAHHSSDFKPVLQELYTEYSSQGLPQTLLLWMHFLAITEFQRVGLLFLENLERNGFSSTFLEKQDAVILCDEVYELLNLYKSIQQTTRKTISGPAFWSQQKSELERFQKRIEPLVQAYMSQAEAMDSFYDRLSGIVASQIKKNRGYKPSFDTLLTPQEYKELCFSPINFTQANALFFDHRAMYADSVPLYDDTYTLRFFFEVIEQSTDSALFNNLESMLCKHLHVRKKKPKATPQPATCEALITELDNLHLFAPGTNTARKKKKNRSRPNYNRKIAHRVPTLQLTPTQFEVAERVNDWYKEHPTALLKISYARLSDAIKVRERQFHSYPFLVTKILMQETEPKEWFSETRQQNNLRYTCPGTISFSESGEEYEGYFADTFGPELYHHYFHQVPFKTLLQRYQNNLPFTNDVEEEEPAPSEKILAQATTTS